jgi:hypothetical protein
MRDTLINAYLDYLNNYLTIDLYSEHNGLTLEQGKILINLGHDVYYSSHPDA